MDAQPHLAPLPCGIITSRTVDSMVVSRWTIPIARPTIGLTATLSRISPHSHPQNWTSLPPLPIHHYPRKRNVSFPNGSPRIGWWKRNISFIIRETGRIATLWPMELPILPTHIVTALPITLIVWESVLLSISNPSKSYPTSQLNGNMRVRIINVVCLIPLPWDVNC